MAGQLSGVEGYVESAASGLVIGITLARRLRDEPDSAPPAETALGALVRHLRRETADFQPSNVVWSMFPALEGPRLRNKRARRDAMVARAQEALGSWLD